VRQRPLVETIALAATRGDWKHLWIKRSPFWAASTTYWHGRVSPEKTTMRPAYSIARERAI
jgi:hypothetical protein